MRAAPAILRSTATVSLLTGLSRILGLVREILMAGFFGTSLAKSAFDVAFRIPNLFRRLFGEGALSAAFVPVFSESVEKNGPADANQLSGRVATMLATALATIVLGGILLVSVLMRSCEWGPKGAAVLPLLRIMFPYMFFICLVALAMGILNSMHHFSVPAATPVILNLVWIAALFVLCPRFGDELHTRIYGVAWGILIAGAIQLAAQVPPLIRAQAFPSLSFRWRDPRVAKILLLMGPAAVGMGIHQINVLVDGFLALWVGTWAPAALTYAERLIYLPLGIFATALGTVLLPSFSRQAVREDNAHMRATVSSSIRSLMLIMMPATAGLVVLSLPIVQLAFQWEGGQFDAESATVTTRALRFYGPGLIVFSLYKILTPAFYALKDTRTPFRVGILCVFINFCLNILFILTWPDGYGHAGLACATVIASAVNCTMLARLLTKRIGSPGWGVVLRSMLRIAAATMLMTVAVILTHPRLIRLLSPLGLPHKATELLGVMGTIVIAIAVYAVAVLILCRPEVRNVRAGLRR